MENSANRYSPHKYMPSVGYHMNGEVISVLSLEGRYYNCDKRVQREMDNYDIVTRVIPIIIQSEVNVIWSG